MVEGKEKLIYVHVVMLGESSIEGLIDSEYTNATNVWYVIKQRRDCSDGAKMTRVFEDVNPLNHPRPALSHTCCEVIGSRIYVIGGLSVMCLRPYQIRDDEGSGEIRFLDTRNPKEGWRTCFTLPFTLSSCKSVVAGDKWLYLFGGNRHDGRFPSEPWGYAVNVDDSKEDEERGREIIQPGNSVYEPVFSCCLCPGSLVAYMDVECTLYELDCMNSAWTVYQRDLPYSSIELAGCTGVFDGIFYIYDTHKMKLTSYDIRNQKELYVVDLPHSFWFGLDNAVELIVLSKDRFCIIQDRHGDDINELLIFYTRFSVSYDTHKPIVALEEKKSFHVHGCRVLNVVAADPHSDAANSSSSNSRSN